MKHPLLGDWLSQYPSSEVLFFLLSYNGKALMLLLGCFILLKLVKGSAANKHLLLSLSMAAIFLLPLTPNFLPTIHIPITVQEPTLAKLPTSINIITAPQQENSTSIAFSVIAIGVGAYLFITALLLLHILWGNFDVFILKLRSIPVTESRWQRIGQQCRTNWAIHRSIEIRHTHAVSSPLTWGVFRPVILIPSSAQSWSDQLIKSTLLHEMAHIRRCDWLVMQLMRAICAFYWLNPYMWKALHKLCANAEAACDDLAISAGIKRSHYAADLLNVAKHIKHRQVFLSNAPAMSATAESADLGYRVRAILNPITPHTPNSAIRIVVTYLLVMCLYFPVSSLQARLVASLPELPSLKKNNTPAALSSSLSNDVLNNEPLTENIIQNTTTNINSENLTSDASLQTSHPPLEPKAHSDEKELKNDILHSGNKAQENIDRKRAIQSSIPEKFISKKNISSTQDTNLQSNSIAQEKDVSNLDSENLAKTSQIELTEKKSKHKEKKIISLPKPKIDTPTDTNSESMNKARKQIVQNIPLQEESSSLSALPFDLSEKTMSQPEVSIEPFERIHMVKPIYPRRASRRGIEGEVVVKFDINTEGKVVHPTIVSAVPSSVFNFNVLKAIKKFLFNPQKVNGEAVNVKDVHETFIFVIQS